MLEASRYFPSDSRKTSRLWNYNARTKERNLNKSSSSQNFRHRNTNF